MADIEVQLGLTPETYKNQSTEVLPCGSLVLKITFIVWEDMFKWDPVLSVFRSIFVCEIQCVNNI